MFDHDKLTSNDLIGEIVFRLQDIQPDLPVTYVRALEQNAEVSKGLCACGGCKRERERERERGGGGGERDGGGGGERDKK